MNNSFERCPHCGDWRQALVHYKDDDDDALTTWGCANRKCPKPSEPRDRLLSKTKRKRYASKLKRLLKEALDPNVKWGEQWELDYSELLNHRRCKRG